MSQNSKAKRDKRKKQQGKRPFLRGRRHRPAGPRVAAGHRRPDHGQCRKPGADAGHAQAPGQRAGEGRPQGQPGILRAAAEAAGHPGRRVRPDR
ncbi:hypothetical protein G6F68_021227 [Rhizopus microsporus]|nr:hypothetical protein G6F68_021227 [Rhizopus microsporus]